MPLGAVLGKKTAKILNALGGEGIWVMSKSDLILLRAALGAVEE
ncbi:hypothetical protein [Streptomyces cyaneofuscatus]